MSNANISAAEAKILFERTKAREIVQEVLRFGVSQDQIVTILNLLAMELEDRSMMLRVIDALREDNEKLGVPKLEV